MDDWALQNQLSIYLHTYGSTHIGYSHQIGIPHMQATNTCSCTETFAAHTCTHTSYSNVICVIVQNLFTCTVTIEVTMKRFHVLHPSCLQSSCHWDLSLQCDQASVLLRAFTLTWVSVLLRPCTLTYLSLWHGSVCSWDLSLWHSPVSVPLRSFTLTWSR